MRVLITDGNERAALAAARSLVRAGHAVDVAAPMQVCLAAVSRGVRGHRLAVDPFVDPAGYAIEVGRLAQQQGTGVLLPMTDASLDAVLEHPESLPTSVALPFPDLATYRAASDKARVLTLAQECGFGVPETRLLATPEGCDSVELDPAFFPAVVKPHRSVVPVGAVRRKTAVTLVADRAACRRALAALPAWAFPV
jgi:predicted ATP-grasp superfamily ATP-dependent carboligase